MTIWPLALLILVSFVVPPARAADAIPFTDGETLRYTINWPSGLGLGEAELSAAHSTVGGGWDFSFRLEAAIPGFAVDDLYTSSATGDLCSLKFRKQLSHGKRHALEETSFDQAGGTATRVTLEGGGSSQIKIPVCAKDGLTFLYYLRRELSRGRIPPPQTILFGAFYEVSFERTGSQKVQLRGAVVEADQLAVSVKSPASMVAFLMLVARDQAHTLVRVTVPLEPGNFTMDLAKE